jgi:hypothetical protein
MEVARALTALKPRLRKSASSWPRSTRPLRTPSSSPRPRWRPTWPPATSVSGCSTKHLSRSWLASRCPGRRSRTAWHRASAGGRLGSSVWGAGGIGWLRRDASPVDRRRAEGIGTKILARSTRLCRSFWRRKKPGQGLSRLAKKLAGLRVSDAPPRAITSLDGAGLAVQAGSWVPYAQ